MRLSLVLSVLALMVAAPTALVACSDDDKSASTSDNEVHSAEPTEPEGAAEGASCWEGKDCADGLVCKKRPSSGPPPGAVGMPLPSSTATHSGPPPGAMGMPLPPNTCQKPAPGEEGSTCRSSTECNRGLVCEQEVSSSSSGGAHFPPGAMGMPIAPKGKCTKDGSSSSGGPPPGALGMPIHP